MIASLPPRRGSHEVQKLKTDMNGQIDEHMDMMTLQTYGNRGGNCRTIL
jgi:hypothetical protein